MGWRVNRGLAGWQVNGLAWRLGGVAKRVPKRLAKRLAKGWQKVGKRLAKGWQKVGKKLAKRATLKPKP